MAEELSILVRLKDLATKELNKISSGFERFATQTPKRLRGVADSILSIKGALAGVGVALSARALKDTVDLAANVESVGLGFENLTQAVGGATDVLAALRRGTRETVSDFKLMETANKAILLDVARSPEEFEKLTTAARRLGRAVGRDTLEAFNDLAIGIGRQSRLILDNLGLIVKVEDANEEYAKSLGKTTSQLTEADKRQAFLNATMKAAEERVSSLGDDTLTLADELGRVDAEILNVRDAILQGLTPALTELAATVADFIRDNRAEILGFFADLIEGAGEAAQQLKEFSEFFTDPGKAIEKGFTEPIDKLRERIARLKADLAAPTQAPRSLESTLRVLAEAEEQLAKHPDFARPIADGAKKAADALREMAAAADFLGPKLEDTFKDQGPPLQAFLDRQSAALERIKQDIVNADEAAKAYAAGGLKAVAEGSDRFADAQKKAAEDAAEFAARMEDARQSAVRAREAIAEMEDPLAGAGKAVRELQVGFTQWGVAAHDAVLNVAGALTDNLTDGIMSLIDGTKSFKEAFRDTAKSILSDIARIIVQTLILKAVQGALGGLGGAFSKGAVFAQGGVTQLGGGGGGIVAGPTTFPMSGGRTGLMGEAGPEGILPLKRGPGGRLGVEASGGGMTQIINVYVTSKNDDPKKDAEFIANVVAQKMRTSASFREANRAA